MKSLVIPSIFTAVDKFTGPVNKMSASSARFERKMNRISNVNADISKKSALVTAGIIAPMALVANEAIKFEDSMSNISTLIDTNNESLSKMGDEILDMSKRIPVPVAELTESLYSIRSAGIAASKQFEVLESSSKLSKAGLSTVSEATNISTSAINAFASENLKASEISNILFKTVKYGKTTISDLAMGFGATAPIVQSANVTLADFSAATAALTTLGTPATQAQTQIRASIIALQKPTAEMTKAFQRLGVTSEKELIQKYGGLVGGFEAVNGALKDMNLNTAKAWSSTEALAAVTSLTGATNEAYLTTLEDMKSGTDALNVAYEKQLKTGKSQAQLAKNNMQSLAITLGTTLIPIINDLVSSISPVLKSFSNWAKENKGVVSFIAKTALAVAAVSGAISVFTGTVSVITKFLAIASRAFGVLNFIMGLNPVFLLIAGVTALGAGLYILAKNISFATREQRLQNEVTQRALDKTVDQRVEVMLLFKALRKATVGSNEYKSTLSKIEAIQPGITKQYNLQAGALKNINEAEKALTKSIIKRAEEEVRAEMIKEKVREALIKKESGPGFMDYAQSLFSGGFISAEMIKNQKVGSLMMDAETLANQQVSSQTEKLNPQKANMTSTVENIKKQTQDVNINFANMPKGVDVDGQTGSNLTIPIMGNTRGK